MNNQEIKPFYFGTYFFEETEDGYLQAYQYSRAQMDYFEKASDFWFERCSASTAKTIEMITDATKISLDYKILWEGSQDSVELMVDGLITRIDYIKDMAKEENLSWQLPACDGSQRNVVIYLPADATMVIKNLEINGTAKAPVKKEKVLWLGDSITQGFGPLRSSQTYVSVANRLLNYDIINQGIGGYVYDKYSLMKMEGYQPDRIIVALGTNQYGSPTMDAVEEYYETLMSIYGNEIPVLCISPLWRGDNPEGIPTLERYCENIKRIAGSYKNVTVIDGFKLVPHLSEYFLDNLHPNCLGAEVYGRNLVEEIRRSW
ncbi:MAG: SGNH/GDSL hydrolase family protein [Lachnospiraceae bacterium]|nr:SGNH/GDSL hydrolase family protein [Lachnospiraceae bacterium]